VASLELITQGQALLREGRLDQAISVLERAMSMDPQNGKSYYYLAEAWLCKGVTTQAREFNQLAGLYLGNRPEWKGKIVDQRRRIEQGTKR
jgi:predicted Zn-dependent protease